MWATLAGTAWTIIYLGTYVQTSEWEGERFIFHDVIGGVCIELPIGLWSSMEKNDNDNNNNNNRPRGALSFLRRKVSAHDFRDPSLQNKRWEASCHKLSVEESF